MPLLFLQLLFLTLLLVLIGEPIRILFSRFSNIPKSLDILQTSLLNIYLGGLLLYIIAMIPLGLFNMSVVLGTTFLFSFLIIPFHWKTIKKFTQCPQKRGSIHAFFSRHKITILESTFVLGMFLVSLWIQLTPLSNFIFGSIHDTSLHALMVEVILENKQVPLTLQPYLPEGIVYPQASHVLFAYTSQVFGFIAPKAVFYTTPLFNALTVLGAYFLGKKLWANKAFYLSLSFIFTFVSSWPMYITWGANPCVVGFPLFLICLALFFSTTNFDAGRNLGDLLFIGILFGYSATIIISFLQTLLVIATFWGVVKLFRKSKHGYVELLGFIALFAFSLIPLSPFLYRFAAFYAYPGRNIGLPPDVMEYSMRQLSLVQPLKWAYEFMSPLPFLSLEIRAIVLASIFPLLLVKRETHVKKVMLCSLAIFCAAFLLTVISYVFISWLNIISWGHQTIFFFIAVNLLMALFNANVISFCKQIKPKLVVKVFGRRLQITILIASLVLSAVYIPFLYFRLMEDPRILSGSYGVYAITSVDDYNLMMWMKANLTQDAVILINPYEAGLFIPSVSHRKVIYPTPGSQSSYSYKRLMNLTWCGVLNETTYELMQRFNITHVFVGSYATYWWEESYKWDPQVFLNDPSHFTLVKREGNAYLFKFSSEPEN